MLVRHRPPGDGGGAPADRKPAQSHPSLFKWLFPSVVPGMD